MNRLPDFDGLRFVFCLGIATFHYAFLIPIENQTVAAIILRFAYFTDIFFIVSGLFLARGRSRVWNRRSYVAFIGKRLARIYPLHVAAFSCFVLISVLTAYGFLHLHSYQPDMSWRNALAQLFLVQSWGFSSSMAYNYVTWSLSALLLMYLCFPFWDMLVDRWGRGLLLAGVAVALLGGDVLSRRMGAPSITRAHLSDIGLLRALPSFLFGMWLAKGPHISMPAWLIRLGLIACVLVFLFFAPPAAAGEPPVLEGVPRLLFLYVFTTLLYAASIRKVWTPLQWPGFERLSRYSFGVYILHPLVGFVFFRLFSPSWVHGTASALVLIAAGVIAVVLVDAVSYRLFENPVNRWLTGKINAWMSRGGDSSGRVASQAGSA